MNDHERVRAITLAINLFTCDFGGTPSIHHFVVAQPFYVRQLIAGKAPEAFHRYGVRYNDAGSILRGNRYRAA